MSSKTEQRTKMTDNQKQRKTSIIKLQLKTEHPNKTNNNNNNNTEQQ